MFGLCGRWQWPVCCLVALQSVLLWSSLASCVGAIRLLSKGSLQHHWITECTDNSRSYDCLVFSVDLTRQGTLRRCRAATNVILPVQTPMAWPVHGTQTNDNKYGVDSAGFGRSVSLPPLHACFARKSIITRAHSSSHSSCSTLMHIRRRTEPLLARSVT